MIGSYTGDCATMSPPYTIANGLLSQSRFVASPNCSERSTVVDLLIIHNISLPPGQFGTGCIEDLFCNRLDPDGDPFFAEIRDLRVSAHLLIDREGRVTQFVHFDKKAWHAGESLHEGRSNCNEFSIGIELEGTDDSGYTDAQYDQLVAITEALFTQFPRLNRERIVGHSDVAPGRKSDPGPGFDWARYRRALADC